MNKDTCVAVLKNYVDTPDFRITYQKYNADKKILGDTKNMYTINRAKSSIVFDSLEYTFDTIVANNYASYVCSILSKQL